MEEFPIVCIEAIILAKMFGYFGVCNVSFDLFGNRGEEPIWAGTA
jgi:hypothetical protein